MNDHAAEILDRVIARNSHLGENDVAICRGGFQTRLETVDHENILKTTVSYA